MEIQKTFFINLSTAREDSSKNVRKNHTCEHESSTSLKKNCNNLIDFAFSTSNVMPPTRKLSQRPDKQRDDS